MMEQIPRTDLESFCRKLEGAKFWNRLSPEERSFRTFISKIALEAESSENKKTRPVQYGVWFSNFEIESLGMRKYFFATNHDNKQQFVVIIENTNTSLYNVSTNKLVRNIPLYDKQITRMVLPAKEGHILTSEYNKKEKSTRISIEAL